MSRGSRLEAAVREQVRIELAVRKALDAGAPKEMLFTRALKHPLVLLIFGSFLTAVVGSFFAAQWQLREWKIQQEHQLEIEEAKEMRELQIETAEAFSETFGAAQDVLHLGDWTWPADSGIVNLNDRGERWAKSSRRWRTAENVLLARVRSKFGKDVADQFVLITEQRIQLGNHIMNILAARDRARVAPLSPDDAAKLETHHKGAKALVVDVMIDGQLARLMRSMETQIRYRERERREYQPTLTLWPSRP